MHQAHWTLAVPAAPPSDSSLLHQEEPMQPPPRPLHVGTPFGIDCVVNCCGMGAAMLLGDSQVREGVCGCLYL